MWLHDVTEIHIMISQLTRRIFFYKIVYMAWSSIFKYSVYQSGKYIFTWRGVLRVKPNLWNLRGYRSEEFAALNFIFGSQQIRFVLNYYSHKRSDMHTTVGLVLNLRYNIEINGKYRHLIQLPEDIRDAEQLRTKKFITWFKFEHRYDNFKGYILKKGLWRVTTGEKGENLLLKRAAIERSVKLKAQNKKKKAKDKSEEDTVLYNKRGNPKTEPMLWKHKRRKYSSWLWFIRLLSTFLKNRPIKINDSIIIRVKGFKKMYKSAIIYLVKCFKNYHILYFLLNFNLKYSNDIMHKVAAIKKKTRKRILKFDKA